jgi:hypothetical protein
MTVTSFSSNKCFEHVPRKGRISFRLQQNEYYQHQSATTDYGYSDATGQCSVEEPTPMNSAVSAQEDAARLPLQASNPKRRYARRGSKCPSMMLMTMRPLLHDLEGEGNVEIKKTQDRSPNKKCTLSILTEALNLSTAHQDGFDISTKHGSIE